MIWSNRFVPIPWAGVLLTWTFFQGCGPSGNAPVNVDIAKQTLQTTLEKWKNGDEITSLQKASPSIVVQDMDWTSGAKLIKFEILSDPKPMDANLIAKVKLKLSDANGQESEKDVTYMVGTAPALTVFRDMFH